jgi:D-alanyl-D-alanine carboxypeptidase
VDEGRLTLADPVRSHLPELRDLNRSITVGQLLDHTSGLADLFNDETRRALEEHPERPWSSDEVLETLHAPWYEPGEGWAYANTNYYLLGLIVERLTGDTLAAQVSSRFVEPLDLEATAVIGDADDAALPPAWSTIFWGSGAMRATAADLARWGNALYSGDILTEEAEQEMLDFNDHDYGLGVQRITARGVEGYGHTGLLNTYTTLLFHVEYADVTVALLVNRSHVDLARMLTIRPPGGSSLLAIALGRAD